jgi:hypothetical protein
MVQQVGRILVVVGLALAALGALLYGLGRLGVGRLPGDLSWGGKSWRVYLPIGTCILASILLTLAMWILSRLRR